ncbi:hypothetical protein [Grapevine leafroll-associated virus 3m]|nr:hypothetical protein [Grapevine leafroll-associated virus 3m]
MELAFIIIQILSALFNNDKTTVFILLNAFKSISDTIGEGVMDNPQAQIDAIKAQVNAVVSQQFYRSIIIDSIDSAFGYDPVGVW